MTFLSKLQKSSISDNKTNRDDIAIEMSEIIFSSFISYMQSVQEVSQKAGQHFASKRWSMNEINASERLNLHQLKVLEVVPQIQDLLNQVILSLIHI